MPRTVEVPARGPLSDLLRKAARVEPLPPSAKFLYGSVAQSVLGRLKVPEPRHRRIAPCFALHDLPRRCVRHAIKMLAGVGRDGTVVPFRERAVRNPVSTVKAESPPYALHTRLARLARRQSGRTAAYGLCTVLYGLCTVSVRFVYGFWDGLPQPRLPRRHPWWHPGAVPEPPFGSPIPAANAGAPLAKSRARYVSRAGVAVCGCVRIRTEFLRECTVLAWPPSASAGLTVLTRRRMTWATAFLADRVHTPTAQRPGYSARPRFPARIRRKPKDAGPWGYVWGWNGGPIRGGTAPCRGVYDSASFNGV